jgi:AbrB family looped-hinge helix DNA binding protein
MPFMSTTLTIDSAGRIVIPKAIREALHLTSGDTLALESDGESVILRPLRPGSPLKKERGIWVFRSGRKLSAEETDQALENVRNERERRARGSRA